MTTSRFWKIVAFLIGALLPLNSASAAVVLNYTHVSGSITKAYNDGKGGVLKTNTGPYDVTGNGSNTLHLIDPANTPPNYRLFAVAGLNGFGALFRGSRATGSMTLGGTYSVTGTPSTGATGSLDGTSVYLNYIAAVGVFELLGSGSTTITSSISVSPFAGQTPGPVPPTITLAAGFATASAGSPDNVTVPFGDVVSGITDGNYPVNVDLSVTASRTGGAVTSMAAWISQDFTWTIDGGAVEPPVEPPYPIEPPFEESPVTQPLPEVFPGVTMTPTTSAFDPENLVVTPTGDLLFSSVDPASLEDPEGYSWDGPDIRVGNAQDLGYLSDLSPRAEGGYFALRSFGFFEGNVDFDDAALLIVDPDSGTTTPVSLSGPLSMPSSLLSIETGFGGASLLITEMALSNNDPAKLLGVDEYGTVAVLIGDLGIEHPIDLAVAPAGFGDLGSKALVLDIGSSSGGTLANGSGSILVVDPDSQATSVFVDGLNAPQSMSFANGAVVGDPGGVYLYVLEQGDQDPVTGILEGNGSLVAYDALGNPSPVADSIAEGVGLAAGIEDSDVLYFSDGDNIFMLTVPEPHSEALLVSGLLLLAILGRGRFPKARSCDIE